MIRLFYVFLVLLLFSCKESGTANSTVQQNERETTPSSVEEDSASQFIENDSLVQAWVAELEMISTAEDRFEVEQELRENRHIEKQIDTVKTLSLGESTLRIYTTTDLYALQSAEIRDEEIAPGNDIRVGMTKDELEQALSTELEGNTVEVGNFTRNQRFIFHFEDNRLERIEFDGYVD